MHPEKYNCDSNRFTLKMFSCIFPGRAWHALHSTSCPTRFGPESSLKPRERDGALSGVRTMDDGLSMSRRKEFLGPDPGLDTSIVGEACTRYRILRIPREGERFSRCLKKETCPHVLLLLQTRLRSENGARSKGGKKGGDMGWHFFANQRVKYLIPVTRAQYHNCLISDGHWDWKLRKVCHS